MNAAHTRISARIPALVIAAAFAAAFAGAVLAQDLRFETLWRVETEGAIHSRPAPDGERIHTGSEDGTLRALDASTGDIAWTYEAGAGTIVALRVIGLPRTPPAE